MAYLIIAPPQTQCEPIWTLKEDFHRNDAFQQKIINQLLNEESFVRIYSKRAFKKYQ